MLFLVIPGIWGLVESCQSLVGQNGRPTYEYTVWADSALNPTAVRVVQLAPLEAIRASMVLLANRDRALPLRHLDQGPIYLTQLGKRLTHFEEYVNYYAKVRYIPLDRLGRQGLPTGSRLILAVDQPDLSPTKLAEVIQGLPKDIQLIVVNFMDHQVLQEVTYLPTLLQAPGSHTMSQVIAAQVVFGGVPVLRGLPTHMAQTLGLNKEFFTDKIRLAYTEPERLDIPGDSLYQIDDIINDAINQFAFPGCQVLVARKGHVIYNKSFGYHTYARQRPVRKHDLYDIASVTKIAATTLASMYMYEQGHIELERPVGSYFLDGSFYATRVRRADTVGVAELAARIGSDSTTTTRWDTTRLSDSTYLVSRWRRGSGRKYEETPVFDIPLRNLLTHYSGLPAGLPTIFYQRSIQSPLFEPVVQRQYEVPVAENFFLDRNYLDTLWNETKSLRVDSAGYCYSCVNMMLMQRVIDSINQCSLDTFLKQAFYQRLGLQTATFNPRRYYPEYRLIPTARDRWRGQLLRGHVHDPMAALMGGISGNAGLFANANDLAILGQMWLNGGQYGGERLLADSTVRLFSRRQQGHRGFGFDLVPRKTDYIVAESAPATTFGHTGFTGTCVWVDPESELVFVFLSNRIHPSVSNQRINTLRVRQRVHQVVYEALGIPRRFEEVEPIHEQPSVEVHEAVFAP